MTIVTHHDSVFWGNDIIVYLFDCLFFLVAGSSETLL